ncbi:MAG: hypothetical protein LBI67_10690 [Treponema sp.]|nr:hypothetical protein [Treponema sp.]
MNSSYGKKRRIILPCVLLCALFSLINPPPLDSWYVMYKEQFYKLFHVHYNQYPDDTMENIYWLEKALKAPFTNALYALSPVETLEQYEKYKYLFMMHINLKLTEQYLFLANKWNKRNAYFYNAPWKEENLKSLDIAETCFNTAAVYWKDAEDWALKAREKRFRFMKLDRVEFWEDEAFRIVEEKTLDYGATIGRELAGLQSVREAFLAME